MELFGVDVYLITRFQLQDIGDAAFEFEGECGWFFAGILRQALFVFVQGLACFPGCFGGHLPDFHDDSIFIEEETYDILIIALPKRDEKQMIVSYAFVFDAQSYYYFDKERSEFVNLETMQKVYEFLNEKGGNYGV